jgi:hypothetical protein
MIMLLRPQSNPHMSPYIRTYQVLRDIWVRLNGLRALFVLSTPHHGDGTEYPVIEYEVDSNNQLVRKPFEFNREVGIDRLLYPTSVREKLLGLLLDSNTTQLTYNIERQTISRRLPEAFSINRRFRELALEKYPNVHIIGKFTSYSAQAAYSDLALVQNWTAASRLFIRAEPGRDQNDPPIILLRFELPEREELSNLRIPITNIVMATLQLPLNTEVQVELACDALPILVRTATLYRLQREMLVFLSDILDAHPSRGTETCPNVQMNGSCVIEEVKYEREDGSKFSIKNQKPDLDSEQMEEEMDYCISKLIEQNEVDVATYVPTLSIPQRDWESDDEHYDLEAPHHPSLLGVAIKLACFLQEAGTAAGYYS